MMRAPAGGVGSTTPNQLLHYQRGSGAPEYCRDPERLLQRLESTINTDQKETGASAQVTASAPGGPVLRIVSPIDTAAGSCRDYYVAEIWGERLVKSTTDYVLLGFGWVRRSCAREVYEAEDARDRARLVDQRLLAVMAACKGTGPTTP